MTQPVVSVITPNAPEPSPPPPQHRLMSISSGPMSEGMIPSVRADDRRGRRNDSAEHVCMFSVCLMFIGVPIIIVGVLCLSIAAPFGIIMTMIGVGASVSGAILVILSGLIALFRLCIKPKPKPEGGEGQTPEIYIDDTLFSEEYTDNLCEEQREQEELAVENLSDLPSLEKLDPVYWSNYPEAQNPRSYLQSFGELPKVMPSPDVRQPRKSSAKDKNRFSKKTKKSGKKIGRRISESLGMGPKRKTLSKTSLTREFNEEIHSDGSSTSLSSASSGRSSHKKQNSNYHKVSANGVGINKSNQSIITIENVGQELVTEEEVLTTSPVVTNDNECTLSSDQMNSHSDSQSVDSFHMIKEQNGSVVAILSDEGMDNIELTEIGDRSAKDKDRYIKDEEFENFSDLWNSIRSSNKS